MNKLLQLNNHQTFPLADWLSRTILYIYLPYSLFHYNPFCICGKVKLYNDICSFHMITGKQSSDISNNMYTYNGVDTGHQWVTSPVVGGTLINVLTRLVREIGALQVTIHKHTSIHVPVVGVLEGAGVALWTFETLVARFGVHTPAHEAGIVHCTL